MVSSGAALKSDETKLAIWLHVFGEDAIKNQNTFDLNDKDRKAHWN